MEKALDLLLHPFTLGLLLGLLIFAFTFYALIKTKLEFRRYRKHLSDKLEIEAKQLQAIHEDKENLGKENENLRIKAAQTQDLPENKLARELELLARAEKQMMVNAPGFAGAWENAKTNAMAEMNAEEQGKSLPKRIFRRFFGSSETHELPVESEAVAELSSQKEEETGSTPDKVGESSTRQS